MLRDLERDCRLGGQPLFDFRVFISMAELLLPSLAYLGFAEAAELTEVAARLAGQPCFYPRILGRFVCYVCLGGTQLAHILQRSRLAVVLASQCRY